MPKSIFQKKSLLQHSQETIVRVSLSLMNQGLPFFILTSSGLLSTSWAFLTDKTQKSKIKILSLNKGMPVIWSPCWSNKGTLETTHLLVYFFLCCYLPIKFEGTSQKEISQKVTWNLLWELKGRVWDFGNRWLSGKPRGKFLCL